MIVRITGGIGNQMFQYALKKSFDLNNCGRNYLDINYYQENEVHNGYELSRVFSIEDEIYKGSIKPPSQKKIMFKVLDKLGVRIFKTPRFIMEILIGFYTNWEKISGEFFYLDGYWQSEDYFSMNEEEIRNVFVFDPFTEEKNVDLLEKINANTAVAVHIRRGDFLSASKFVCLGKTNYYNKAIDYIKRNVKDPLFIVLSDDISWCRENIDFGENIIYVDWNIGNKSFRDMQIMSCCCHNIIANSTFSWWGAWLNRNPNKIVVAPYKFYHGIKRDESHLIPKNWVKIHYDFVQ